MAPTSLTTHSQICQPAPVSVATRQVFDIDVAGFEKLDEPALRVLAEGLLSVATQVGWTDLGRIKAGQPNDLALARDLDRVAVLHPNVSSVDWLCIRRRAEHEAGCECQVLDQLKAPVASHRANLVLQPT